MSPALRCLACWGGEASFLFQQGLEDYGSRCSERLIIDRQTIASRILQNIFLINICISCTCDLAKGYPTMLLRGLGVGNCPDDSLRLTRTVSDVRPEIPQVSNRSSTSRTLHMLTASA